MSKTLEEIKQEYAKSYGCITWEEYKEDLPVKDLEIDCFEISELYAKEQNKELVEMLEKAENRIDNLLILADFMTIETKNSYNDDIKELLTKYK